MRVFRTIAEFRRQADPRLQNCVTIGNFDGFHLGHQRLFEELFAGSEKIAAEKNQNARKILLTFWPHPRKLLGNFAGNQWARAPQSHMLTPIRTKFELATGFGFDAFVAARFNRALAELSPDQFAQYFLVQGLGAKLVVVGYDWRFGKNREGNAERLIELGKKHGFAVSIVPEVTASSARISSSAVRKAVQGADFQKIRELLGRRFSISARVVSGEQRGRQLGFPTANLHLLHQVLPPDGVYAVLARVDGKVNPAVANIGVRPTFYEGRRLMEVHLLGDEVYDLYRKRLHVEFVSRIRDEMRFGGPAELKAQIAKDILVARETLTNEID